MGDNPRNPYEKIYPLREGKKPLWPTSGPLFNPGMTTRQRAADSAENMRVYNAESDGVVRKIREESDARQAQALADSRYCGAAGCARKVVESLFGKQKTAGRRRRHRNKKGKKTLKRRSGR